MVCPYMVVGLRHQMQATPKTQSNRTILNKVKILKKTECATMKQTILQREEERSRL